MEVARGRDPGQQFAHVRRLQDPDGAITHPLGKSCIEGHELVADGATEVADRDPALLGHVLEHFD